MLFFSFNIYFTIAFTTQHKGGSLLSCPWRRAHPDTTEWSQRRGQTAPPHARGWWEAWGFLQHQCRYWEDKRLGATHTFGSPLRGSWGNLSDWDGSITKTFFCLKNDPISHLRLALVKSSGSSSFIAGLQPYRHRTYVLPQHFCFKHL